MFKVLGTLTNVRPSKTETPELNTAPSNGIIKLNAPACKLLGVTNGDLVTIVPAEDENGKSLYITKGKAGSETESQVGAKLSSAAGKDKTGGSLQFGSENAWRELSGNNNEKMVYTINETPVVYEGANYFQITFNRAEAKMARVKKAATA